MVMTHPREPDGASMTVEELNTMVEDPAQGSDSQEPSEPVTVHRVTAQGNITERKQTLLQLLPEMELLDLPSKERLCELITTHHEAFSLERSEWGETDLHGALPDQYW